VSLSALSFGGGVDRALVARVCEFLLWPWMPSMFSRFSAGSDNFIIFHSKYKHFQNFNRKIKRKRKKDHIVDEKLDLAQLYTNLLAS
jgi:hypothetical protein